MPDTRGPIEGLRAALGLRLHHYSSFSLAHSFSEREGAPYSIDVWMQTPLTVEQVRETRLPLSDGYFEDDEGQTVPRMQFDYIRDHLGYRLELQRAMFPPQISAARELTVEVELINRGFSVLHNPRPVLFVLIGEEGLIEFPVGDAAPCRWQPFEPGDAEFTPLRHSFGQTSLLPQGLPPGLYQLGLWLPDAAPRLRRDARYAVRMANRGVPWWVDAQGNYGVNLLGEVEITP